MRESRILIDNNFYYKQYDISDEMDALARVISEKTVLTHAQAHERLSEFIEDLLETHAPGGVIDGD
jgi:fido (protein-threonine AMPylation protein)